MSSRRPRCLRLYDPDRSQAGRRAARSPPGTLSRARSGRRLGSTRGGQGAGCGCSPAADLAHACCRSPSCKPGFPDCAGTCYDPCRRRRAAAGARRLRPAADAAAAARGRRRHRRARRRPARPRPRADRRTRSGFADRRAAAAAASARLYSAECAHDADRRLCGPPHGGAPDRIETMIAALAERLGAALSAPDLPPEEAPLSPRSPRTCRRIAGARSCLAGPALPAEVHALAHWINGRLARPSSLRSSRSRGEAGTLADSRRICRPGRFDTLLISRLQSGHDAPGDLDFAALLPRAPFRAASRPLPRRNGRGLRSGTCPRHTRSNLGRPCRARTAPPASSSR